MCVKNRTARLKKAAVHTFICVWQQKRSDTTTELHRGEEVQGYVDHTCSMWCSINTEDTHTVPTHLFPTGHERGVKSQLSVGYKTNQMMLEVFSNILNVWKISFSTTKKSTMGSVVWEISCWQTFVRTHHFLWASYLSCIEQTITGHTQVITELHTTGNRRTTGWMDNGWKTFPLKPALNVRVSIVRCALKEEKWKIHKSSQCLSDSQNPTSTYNGCDVCVLDQHRKIKRSSRHSKLSENISTYAVKSELPNFP